MKYDFQKILAFLTATGLTFKEVGEATQVPSQAISRIAKGQMPRHDQGEAILAFYRQRKEEITVLMSQN